MSGLLKQVAQQAARGLATKGSSGSLPPRKVAVLGAAGGIGQPLSMLMKVGSGTPGDSTLARPGPAPALRRGTVALMGCTCGRHRAGAGVNACTPSLFPDEPTRFRAGAV